MPLIILKPLCKCIYIELMVLLLSKWCEYILHCLQQVLGQMWGLWEGCRRRRRRRRCNQKVSINTQKHPTRVPLAQRSLWSDHAGWKALCWGWRGVRWRGGGTLLTGGCVWAGSQPPFPHSLSHLLHILLKGVSERGGWRGGGWLFEEEVSHNRSVPSWGQWVIVFNWQLLSEDVFPPNFWCFSPLSLCCHLCNEVKIKHRNTE